MTGHVPTCLLDWVFTNEEDPLSHISYDTPIGKSDHITLNMHLLNGTEEKEAESYVRSYDKMRESLKDIHWGKVLQELTGLDAWNFFEKTVHSSIESYVALK